MFNLFKSRASAPAPAPEAAGPSRSALVPRIKHLAFERALRDRGIPAPYLPLVEALAGELLVTYAFDLPDQFVMANPTNLEQAGIAPSAALALARDNLRARLPQIRIERQRGALIVSTGGDLEACVLLLDELWSGAQARFGEGSVVCVPRRDCLLLSDGTSADAVAALRKAAGPAFAAQHDAHALSLQLMSRLDSAWRVHEK